ncbi:MAG: hypothetical protein K2Z81_05545, partial [Cyanobacteria bacterium]|nr:hypothetical protein [Cyanobacteriota bacterium]
WNLEHGLESAGIIKVPATLALPLYLEDGTQWGTLWDAVDNAIPRANRIGIVTGEFIFSMPTFLHTGNEALPRFKLHKVWAEAELTYSIQPTEVRRTVTEVLRSVIKDQKYLVDDFGKLVSETEPFEASGDILFPDGHTMKLSIVNIGHLSEEAKKEYRESMQRQADEINSGKITYPAKVVEQQSADHQ